MTFELADVVPWGRSYDEYLAMFALTPADLEKRILGCGDGPASFNATMNAMKRRVVSIDPLYRFSADQIRSRVEDTAKTIERQTRKNASEFVWKNFQSVDDLIRTRLSAMERFLHDYPAGLAEGRYVDEALPDLSFESDAFDLGLCSHFLFLYAAQLDLEFHVRSIRELTRVAREVRIFPLLELGAKRSRHLDPALRALRSAGYRTEIRPVEYEFQKGGNEMLVVRTAD